MNSHFFTASFLWPEKQVSQLLFLFFFIGYFFQYD